MIRIQYWRHGPYVKFQIVDSPRDLEVSGAHFDFVSSACPQLDRGKLYVWGNDRSMDSRVLQADHLTWHTLHHDMLEIGAEVEELPVITLDQEFWNRSRDKKSLSRREKAG